MIAKRHIPNALCWLRFALVIPMLWVWAFAPQAYHYPVVFGCFLIASITDFLDGYLARKWQVESVFGAMIDQITDKLVVVTVLVLLVSNAIVAPYAPIIIILREVYVSGLREAMAIQHIAMPVSKLGKYKTATQMLALVLLLAAPGLLVPMGWVNSYGVMYVIEAGRALLWIAALLATISAVHYTKAALRA